MALEQVDDHVTEALELMLAQFKGKPAFEGLVSAVVRPLNDVETDAFALTLRTLIIADSEGDQLDGIGSIVGLTRGGRSDADYRLALAEEIALHASAGRTNDLISICGGEVAIREYATPFAEFEAVSRDAQGCCPPPNDMRT